jgi:hypothetical protein
MIDFQIVPYQQWGPWRNHWGYVTSIAEFDDDIIVKSITPSKKKIIKRFINWESCEEFLDLIEQDRRF